MWGWKADVYATTKEFVTFPSELGLSSRAVDVDAADISIDTAALTTPVDIASVANQVASGAASVANVVGGRSSRFGAVSLPS